MLNSDIIEGLNVGTKSSAPFFLCCNNDWYKKSRKKLCFDYAGKK